MAYTPTTGLAGKVAKRKAAEAAGPLMTSAQMMGVNPNISAQAKLAQSGIGGAYQQWTQILDNSPTGYMAGSNSQLPTTGYNPNARLDAQGRPPENPSYSWPATKAATFGSYSAPAPTVATKANPVVSKTYGTSGVYTPKDFSHLEAMDLNGLQDAADYYSVQQAKRALTDQEQLDLRKIQRLMQAQAAPQDPSTQYNKLIADKEAEEASKRAEMEKQDMTTLDLYKQQQDLEYKKQEEEARAAWERERDAAQGILSFSWFGRSTKAADVQSTIQAKIESNIGILQAKKNAENQAKELELAGATDEALEPIRQYINQLNTKQIEGVSDFIKQTNEYNQKLAGTYQEKIDNILKATQSSGMTYDKLNSEQKVRADAYAKLALNKDGEINETFMKTVPGDLQFAVLQKAAESAGAKMNTKWADTVTVGSGKSSRVMQWNPATQRYDIPVAGGGMWGWGSGGWVINGVKAADQPLVNLLVQYKDFLKESTAFGNKLDPNMSAKKNGLIWLITAEYKQAKKLGTLDAGVEKLINGVLGNRGTASWANDAQIIAVDQFLNSLWSTSPAAWSANTTQKDTWNPNYKYVPGNKFTRGWKEYIMQPDGNFYPVK